MIGFFLYWLAWLLYPFLTIFNALNVRKKGYFMDSAINIDKFANRELRFSLNKHLIKQDAEHKFGDINQTISGVLGLNIKFSKKKVYNKIKFTYFYAGYFYIQLNSYSNMTVLGNIICNILDTIDPNHCINSIKYIKMDNTKIYLESEPTEMQLDAINEAKAILAAAGLELIGTRPNRR